MKKTILLGLIFLLGGVVNAQFLDKYGLRLGGTISNQFWEYNGSLITDVNGWKENKLGLNLFLNAEKELNNFLSIRPEIGYLQKGFTSDFDLSILGETITTKNTKVTLHNLTVDIGLKISPVDYIIKPYLTAGIRGNYMLGYKDFEIEFLGVTYEPYKPFIEEFNQVTFSGLIGVGFEYDDLIYMEFEFAPPLTNNLDDKGLLVKDRYYGVTIGLNISELIK